MKNEFLEYLGPGDASAPHWLGPRITMAENTGMGGHKATHGRVGGRNGREVNLYSLLHLQTNKH